MVGKRQVGSELSADTHIPAVLDDETYQKARAVLTNPNRGSNNGRTVKSLLVGFLVCGLCGAKLSTKVRSMNAKGSEQHRYQCLKLRGGCGKVSVNAAPTEPFVVSAWLNFTRSPEYAAFTAERRAERAARTGNREKLQATLDLDRGQRNTLIDMWTAGNLSQNEWLRARATLDDRIKAAEQAVAESQTVTLGIDLDSEWWEKDYGFERSSWNAASLGVQRQLLGTSLDRVIVHPAKARGRRFDATRLEPIFKQPTGLHPGELFQVQELESVSPAQAKALAAQAVRETPKELMDGVGSRSNPD
jgi:hypothetical protein